MIHNELLKSLISGRTAVSSYSQQRANILPFEANYHISLPSRRLSFST